MTGKSVNFGPSSLADYASILWRRRLTMLAFVIGVPLAAVLLSSFQSAEYRAASEVLIRSQSLAATLSGVPDPSAGQDPARLLDTQARLARTPVVARAAGVLAGGMLPDAMLKSTSVSADPSADILTFTATTSTPGSAIRLANAYANAFARYRSNLDLAPIEDALKVVNGRISRLKRSGSTSSAAYTTLVARQQQLESLSALRSQSAVVVSRADAAPKVRPRPLYAGFLGLIVGILLGVAVSLLREAVEKRTRSPEQLQQHLDLRVVGRIPTTAEGGAGLVSVSHPNSVDAEAYRILRMHFEQVLESSGGKVFAVVSGGEGEGKSTVASNLAVSLARVGRDVLLVDCDPLRPVLRERFDLRRIGAGVFEVATGDASLESVMSDVPFSMTKLDANEFPGGLHARSGAENVEPLVRNLSEATEVPRLSIRIVDGVGPGTGRLRVLPANPASVDASDFFVATKLEGLLGQLRDEADLVILDAAPLSTSTGMGAARMVDGLLVVANVALMRRPMLEHLSELLDDVAVAKIGLVLTGLELDATMSYGYRYYAEAPAEVTASETPDAAPRAVEGRWSSAS